MVVPCVVLDTNVLVAAIRSRRGASFRVLERVGRGRFEIALSVTMVLEYEEVPHRHRVASGLEATDVQDLLDYLCNVGRHQAVFYMPCWRRSRTPSPTQQISSRDRAGEAEDKTQ